jgi:hypothetical protein
MVGQTLTHCVTSQHTCHSEEGFADEESPVTTVVANVQAGDSSSRQMLLGMTAGGGPHTCYTLGCGRSPR